jgi:thioredoxin 1
MKKLLFILAIAVFSLQSCNSSQAENGNEKSQGTSESAGLFREAETSGSVETSVKNNQDEGGSIKMTKEKFLKEVWDYESSPQDWNYKGDKPALIDFYADWCGPCKIASPILDEISNEYAGDIYVYKIDTEKERELASVFGIKGIPAFLYIPTEGKPVMMSGIGRSKEQTKEMFKDNIDKYLLTSN